MDNETSNLISKSKPYQDARIAILTPNRNKPRNPFEAACYKLYQSSKKLLSEANYNLLLKYQEFAETIVINLRPNVIKDIFGFHQNDSEEVIAQRIFILNILTQSGIIKNNNGVIEDQDWIKFLTVISYDKLAQYYQVFALINRSDCPISDPKWFAGLKSHNDLSDQTLKAIESSFGIFLSYGTPLTWSQGSQIIGFTLVNEYVCKRARFFPGPWKEAMKAVWSDPGKIDNSFQLYKLYSERFLWLDSYKSRPIIYNFLKFFYGRTIFQTFNAEPLTQVCNLLQAQNRLNRKNFEYVASMSATQLEFCQLFNQRGVFDENNLSRIADIPEEILKNIGEHKDAVTLLRLPILIRLGQNRIDPTCWIENVTNWVAIDKLNDDTMNNLRSLSLNADIFAKIQYFYKENFIDRFNQLNPELQEHLLTSNNHVSMIDILNQFDQEFFKKVFNQLPIIQQMDLLKSGNHQVLEPLLRRQYTQQHGITMNYNLIFQHQQLLSENESLRDSVFNIDLPSPERYRKRLNGYLHQYPTNVSEPDFASRALVFDLPLPENRDYQQLTGEIDKDLKQEITEKLEKLGITGVNEVLDAYSTQVLMGFHALYPLFVENQLLRNKESFQTSLELFTQAENPEIRNGCIILLAQYGLLNQKTLKTSIELLEKAALKDPQFYKKTYDDAFTKNDLNAKSLTDEIAKINFKVNNSKVCPANSAANGAYLANENGAYLALEDNKWLLHSHPCSEKISEAFRLLDKNKIRIECFFAEFIAEENIKKMEKMMAWLFVLDRAGLCQPDSIRLILQHPLQFEQFNGFPMDIMEVLQLKQQDYLKKVLDPTLFAQLLKAEVSIDEKKTIIKFIKKQISNPSATEKFVFNATAAAAAIGNAAKSAGKAISETTSNTVMAAAAASTKSVSTAISHAKTPGILASALSSVSLPARFFRDSTDYKPLINKYSDSYFAKNFDQFSLAISALKSQDAGSEENAITLLQQGDNQELAGRCIRLLAAGNLIKNNPGWRNSMFLLMTTPNFSELEQKCQKILHSDSSEDDKVSTINFWLTASLTPPPSNSSKS